MTPRHHHHHHDHVTTQDRGVGRQEVRWDAGRPADRAKFLEVEGRLDMKTASIANLSFLSPNRV